MRWLILALIPTYLILMCFVDWMFLLFQYMAVAHIVVSGVKHLRQTAKEAWSSQGNTHVMVRETS